MNQKDFKNKSEMQIFLSYFKPHRKLFLLDMVCALAIALIDLAFPFISRWCMYKLLPDNAWRTFWTVMAVVFCAYILRSVFTYIITYWGHTFGVRIETDFRRDLFQHIQELSYAYFDNARVGQLMSQLTSELFDITEFAHHAPEDIFYFYCDDHWCTDHYVYDSVETGTGNRNYHSDFSAHCVEMPFFHAECIAQCKKRDGSD